MTITFVRNKDNQTLKIYDVKKYSPSEKWHHVETEKTKTAYSTELYALIVIND